MKILQTISFVAALLVFGSIAVFAQENNTKVLKYIAPKYPITAQLVRASGTVIVGVKIDKSGKVSSSVAESGHQLLRKVSENDAKDWLFSADSTIGEREAKITFSFRLGDRNKKDKLKFKKPYTLEVVVARSRIIIDKHPGY